MNLTSIYRSRLTGESLRTYTLKIARLLELRTVGKISKEELGKRLGRAMDKFVKKYGE